MRKPIVLAAAVILFASVASAQKYGMDDPIPPGATGKVLPLQARILDIRGISSGVSAKAEALGKSLSDLGATAKGTEVHVQLSADVLFEFDKSDLKPEAAPSLEKIVDALKQYPGASMTIEGHTDGKGAHDYNQRLSERRASTVENWFRAHGFAGSIASHGLGDTHPLVPNTNPDGTDNPENRQKNRRVEIVISTK